MKKEELITRINDCINLGLEYKKYRYDTSDDEKQKRLGKRWYSQTLTCLTDIFGSSHTYTVNYRNTCGSEQFPSIDQGLGILDGAIEDIGKGYLNTLFNAISSEIFADILDIAQYFIDDNHKDPAAIIIGISLETHLKQLCKTNGISIDVISENGDVKYKKASLLNNELAKADVYTKLDEKMITAMLAIRNNAAHGNFSEYNIDQVKNMYSNVLEIIKRTSP